VGVDVRGGGQGFEGQPKSSPKPWGPQGTLEEKVAVRARAVGHVDEGEAERERESQEELLGRLGCLPFSLLPPGSAFLLHSVWQQG
jgi:hypothetical protein